MKIKTVLFTSIATLSLIPALAFADVVVHNNTNSFATAGTAGMCSSTVSVGILKPKSDFSIPQAAINFLCGMRPCKAEVYMNKNCGAPSIATVTVDKNKGITNINPHGDGHFSIVGNGNNASIEEKQGLMERMFRFIF